MWRREICDGILAASWEGAVPPSGGGDWMGLDRLVAEALGASWVFDLSPVRQLASEDLAALIAAVRRVQEGGGRVAFHGVGSSLAVVFSSVRLTRLAELHADRASALAAVRPKR